MSAQRRATRPADIVRVAGRFAFAMAIACVLGLVAMQFEGIVVKNVAIAREVSATRADVEALRTRKRRQFGTIGRLNNAAGAIPEIHEKLRLVGRHEEIIYVRGSAASTAAPDDDGTAR